MATRTRSLPATDVLPSRESRLFLDGVRSWVQSISAAPHEAPYIGILESEPGQGTALLVRSLRSASPGVGLRFASARCWSAAPGPAGACRELVEALVELVEAEASAAGERVLEQHAAVLGAVLPERLGHEAAGQLPTLGALQDRVRLFDSIASLALAAGRGSPAVLVVEDADLADRFLQDALRHLLRVLAAKARRRSGHRLLLVLSGSKGDAGALFGLDELEDDHGVAFRVTLRGYSREDLQRVVAGRGGDSGLSTRERVLRVTGGNTRQVLWIVRRMEREGDWSAPWLDDRTSFESLVAEEFAALDPPERSVVSWLVALGEPVTAARLATVIDSAPGVSEGSASEEVAASLARLEAEGWVSGSGREGGAWGQRYGIEPRLADALRGAEEPSRLADWTAHAATALCDRRSRQGVHATLACSALLRAAEARREARSRGQRRLALAVDTSLSRLATEVARLAPTAVAFLERHGCPREALEIAEGALALDGAKRRQSDADMPRFVSRLLELSGNFREALEDSRARLGEATSDESRAGEWLHIGDLHGRLAEHQEQDDAYREGLRCSTDGGSDVRFALEAAVIERALESGDLATCDRRISAAVRALDDRDLGLAAALPGGRLRWLRIAATVRERQRRLSEAVDLERRALAICEKRGAVVEVLRSLREAARRLTALGQSADATTCLGRIEKIGAACSSRYWLAVAAQGHGEQAVQQGLHDDAVRLLEKARNIQSELGFAHEVDTLDTLLVECELRGGRFQPLARALERLVERRFGCRVAWPFHSRSAPVSVSLGQRRVIAGEGTHGAVVAVVAAARADVARGDLASAFRGVEAELSRREVVLEVLDRALLTLTLGRLARLRGDFDLAMKSYTQSVKALVSGGHHELLFEAYLEIASASLERWHLDKALEYLSRGLRLALESGDPRACALGLRGLSELLVETGEASCAAVVAALSSEVARSLEDSGLEVDALVVCARGLSESGHEEAARRAFFRASELLERAPDSPSRCRLLIERAWHALRSAEWRRAGDDAHRALDEARAIGASSLAVEAAIVCGAVESDRDNPRKNYLRALERLEQSLQTTEKAHRPHRAREILRLLASAHSRRGKNELAAAYARRSEEIASRARPPSGPAAWRRVTMPFRLTTVS